MFDTESLDGHNQMDSWLHSSRLATYVSCTQDVGGQICFDVTSLRRIAKQKQSEKGTFEINPTASSHLSKWQALPVESCGNRHV